MLESKFYAWLAGLTVTSLAVVLILSWFEPFVDSRPLSIFSVVFFSLLCIAVQYLGKRAARSTNKNLLTQLIMIVVFLKLFCCLFLVIGYDQFYAPSTNHFVLPFIFLYLVYTSFEVIILMRASRLSQG